MPCFAARRRAGVQNAPRLPCLAPLQQQWGCHLRGGVLHRHMTQSKAGQLLHRHRALELQTRCAHGLGGQSHGQQLRLVLGHAVVTGVHTQGHGGRVLRHVEKFLPVFGVFVLHTGHPPSRVVPACLRVAVRFCHQGFPFAQQTPQTAVDEPALCLGLPLLAGGLDRLVDQGVHRVGRVVALPAQGQGRAQQGVGSWGRYFAGQTLAQRHGSAQLPHHLKSEGLNPRAQLGRHAGQFSGQRAPGPHRLDHRSRDLQLPPKRKGLARAGIAGSWTLRSCSCWQR